ncbi:unnamed protein product [Angiostrongylus costaricensis]|uniref:Aa_trans domain-containing protein n=1 Tax=Angiostrongylus costaricensis TaxID=334426 RepID=A0A158PGG1_ANGCS|nr:unnamed protein product [Angiostrongylus costaricensis]
MFSHYPLGLRKAQPRLDYANVMRSAVEIGPSWIRDHGYFCKSIDILLTILITNGECKHVSSTIRFLFTNKDLLCTSYIHISQAGWIALLLIPTMALCTVRELRALAPLAAVANVVYLIAVCIVLQHLFQFDRRTISLPAVGNWSTLPLFFGTVMFAFEGVAVVLPIESQMDEPLHFVTNNGVLNTSCLLVLIVYMTVGFFGYLRFGSDVKDTLTLNLPQTNFYQTIKLMFVACILVSYPLQFYVPMERVEKWIKRKVAVQRQENLIYGIRLLGVLCTCVVAELIPHLALFISLVGSVAGTSLTLVFPPIIELLCCYSKNSLTPWIWIRNIFLMMFAVVGFASGTYTSMLQIVSTFAKPNI